MFFYAYVYDVYDVYDVKDKPNCKFGIGKVLNTDIIQTFDSKEEWENHPERLLWVN